jgi:hypothetical protein
MIDKELLMDAYSKLNEILKIQCNDGNWNYDPYQHGMANGLILAKYLMDRIEPKYLDAPKRWLKDVEWRKVKIPSATPNI